MEVLHSCKLVAEPPQNSNVDPLRGHGYAGKIAAELVSANYCFEPKL